MARELRSHNITMKRYNIKVCGMTYAQNVMKVLDLDIDAIGIVSCLTSPRTRRFSGGKTTLSTGCETGPQSRATLGGEGH